jgi:phage-related protein
MMSKFTVEFLPEAVEFMNNLDQKAREKIYFNIKKSQVITDIELFKKLNADIWEFRTLYNGIAYRLFAFWDRTKKNETLVIATHGIFKKTNKTPAKEIERAERIREQYLKDKI